MGTATATTATATANEPLLVRRSTLFRALYTTVRQEGVLALWRGIGPTMVGTVPSRAIYFAAYNKFKPLMIQLNYGYENSAVHLCAGILAGIVTTSLTNPIWVVKTQVQLIVAEHKVGQPRVKSLSWKVIQRIWHVEGIKGFMRGVSASYIG